MAITEWSSHPALITARRFATIYAIWSAVWILVSDYVLQLAINGPHVVWKMQSFKGLFYVCVSALILFMAVRERDRKHEAMRAKNAAMLQRLRRSGLLWIYEWGPDGRLTDANEYLLEVLGYTREELLSGRLTREAITPPEYWEKDRIANEQVAQRGCCDLYEKEVTCKDGTRIQVLTGRALWEGEQLGSFRGGGIGYAIDITQRKQMEAEHGQLRQQLLQSEKLNALGQLAGGIAHDFNNLLSIIVGYASLMEAHLGPKDEKLRENTIHVLKAAEKACNLTRKLLAFSRKELLNLERLNLN